MPLLVQVLPLPFAVPLMAVFSTGGPIYTLYLMRRLPELDVFRATISAVIFISAVLRLLFFGAGGLYAQTGLLPLALGLLLPSLLGLDLGTRWRQRLPVAAIRRFMLLFMMVAAAVVVLRGLWMLSPAAPAWL